jgi:3-hydroxyacyl-[acyl-carrier-protein] dehydratase
VRFFLVDRVTEVVVGERVRGAKCVTLTDEVLHDHFPDHPIFPGTLLVEAVAQLAGYLLEATFDAEARAAGDEARLTSPLRAILTKIDDARFYEAASPGDRLDLEARISSIMGTAAQVKGEVKIDGKRAARVGLTFVLRAVDSPRVHEQRRALYRIWARSLPGAPLP